MGSPVSQPRVTISLLPAALVDAFADRRDLIVGQKGSAGSAADKALVRDVHLLSQTEIIAQFGDDELYHRIQYFRAANGGFSPLDVIPVNAAGGGTAGTGVITVTGTATAAGTLSFETVDGRQFSFDVFVASGDTPTQIGDKIVTAINALTRPPFSAANAVGVVTLTASDVGTVPNNWGLRTSGAVAGVTVGLTAWAGGATDPSLTGVFDAIDGRRYTGISWPEYWNANLSLVTDLLDARFNAANDILDGVAFHGQSATFANAQSAVSSLNSQSLVVGGNSVDSNGPVILQPADWVLAYFMGVRARRLTPGATIADFIVSTNGPLDAFGGPSLASLPYFNTPLALVPVSTPADHYSSQEQSTLEDAGFSSFGVNSAGNAMIMGPVVTTWTTDDAGNDNDSFHYLNFVDTGGVAREIFHRTLKSVYAQSRLTEGDLIPGRSMANAESIKSELLRIYRVLAQIALVQDGREAESFFAQNTDVVVNLAQRSVTITGPLPIVTQIGSINYTLQLAFTVGQTGTQITF